MRGTTESSSREREPGTTPDGRQAGSRRRSQRLRWAQRLLVSTGTAMLAWSAWVFVDAIRSQEAARRSLESAGSVGAAAPEPASATADRPILPGSAVATLNIPRIRLSTVVLHGSDARTLRRGPGHLERTALPGEPGNIVIAGHRDTFFRPLRQIAVGDSVVLESSRGRFEYRVSSLDVVKSDDVSVLEQGGEDLLTLITCYPFNLVGSAPDRFVARATRVTRPGTSAAAAREVLPRDVERPAIAAATDDRTLVRGAIERFRATYNARLVSHGELATRSLLTFRRCEVVASRDTAEATCGVDEPAQDHVQTWTFHLTRVDGTWTIRSIAFD
jgi:sortase A